MNGVVPYGEGKGRVIVYETLANEGMVSFGVLIPFEEAAEHELNRRAVTAAKEFLRSINADPAWVKISGCSRCHVDDLASYAGQLWHLPAFRAWIFPKLGCPKLPAT